MAAHFHYLDPDEMLEQLDSRLLNYWLAYCRLEGPFSQEWYKVGSICAMLSSGAKPEDFIPMPRKATSPAAMYKSFVAAAKVYNMSVASAK